MSIIFLIIFLIIFIIIQQNKNVLARRFSHIIFGMWFFLVFYSLSNPIHLYPVSNETYLVIMLFLASLMLGISVPFNSKTSSVNIDYKQIRSAFESLAFSKIFIFLVIFCDLFLLFLYQAQEQLLASMSAHELRMEGIQELIFQGNSLMGLTNNFIVAPVRIFVDTFFAYILIFDRKRVGPLFVYGVYIFLNGYIGGSRGSILKLFIFIIFLFYCCYFLMKGINTKKVIKSLASISLAAIAALSVVSFMTNQRANNENTFSTEAIVAGFDDTSEHFVTYSIGPFRALDLSFKQDYVEQLGGYKYGRSTFGFIDEFVELIGKRLGSGFERANKRIYDKLQNTWIDIPYNFNFAYTAIFNFYVDFGFGGIVFLPFLFGVIIKRTCKRFYETGNPITLLLVAYLFSVAFDMYFTWRMYQLSALITLIWIYALNRIYLKKQKSVVR